jgi:transposase InsO family protein
MADHHDDDEDPRRAMALLRYQIISAYLALEPGRGQKRPLLEQLAARTWLDPIGQPLTVAAETIRSWVRRYREGGLAGLEDQLRSRRGTTALTPEELELAAQLKREVPERSLDRLIHILEETRLVEPGHIRRSTLHRALRALGLSQTKPRVPDAEDLDRFEADAPNDLWQSDLLTGPWLPDPARPGKSRRACLYAFLDDHSRLLLYGRFSFRGELPALELVFRRALQRWGTPRRVYYDNGQVYRSKHMRHIVATLGLHHPVFTKKGRPMGHGKIEAFNRFIRNAFLAELRASHIRTLDALNEAFVAWADVEYNRRPHGETGEPPLDRWRKAVERIRYADDDKLRDAFLWGEDRTPDKSGVFSLLGERYQTTVGRRRIKVRYDPEALAEIEVWLDGKFVERVRPFVVQTHRRPKPRLKDDERPASAPPAAPTVDWLAHLVERRQREAFVEPSPRQIAAGVAVRRERWDQEVTALLVQRLDPAVFDEAIVREFLARFGPFDPAAVAVALDAMFAHGARADQHPSVLLETLRQRLHGGAP